MHLIAIAAMAENRVIGNHGKIPWNIPEEQQLFKQETLGSPIIMGKSTFESIGRCLPGRRNIVLSREEIVFPPDMKLKPEVFSSIERALEACKSEEKVFICGGGQIYRAFFDRGIVDEVVLSVIPGMPEGEVFFPVFESGFSEMSREQHEGFERVRYKKLLIHV